MTAAQRAMATAMIYPEAPRGRGKKEEAKGDATSSFSYRRLQLARTVLANSLLAQAVLGGSLAKPSTPDEVREAVMPCQTTTSVQCLVATTRQLNAASSTG